MEPEIASIILDMVTDTSSIVEITYRVPKIYDGIELMGVDAGLSWLKGQSISLKKHHVEDDITFYVGYLEVTTDCEFRARAFDDEGDHWEAGLGNHRIERNPDGTITFESELDDDFYYFRGSPPTIMNPSLEEAKNRLLNVEEENPSLYQTLVDLSVWIDEVEKNPLSESTIHPISAIIRHIKVKTRELESQTVDNIVLPIQKILFEIYKSALEFHKEDVRWLTGEWGNHNYIGQIKDLPEKVKELEKNPSIGRGQDAGDRFRSLLEFVS